MILARVLDQLLAPAQPLREYAFANISA